MPRCIDGFMERVDQRGFVNQRRADATGLSGRDAADLLGVKRETLYAYVSRGLVRSERAHGKAGHRYRRDDLLRLKARSDARAGHGAVAAGALRWGEPVLPSAVSTIDARGPIYRGHRATLLAAGHPFESVAELLWSGTLPVARPAWSADGLGVRTSALAALLPEDARPLTTLSLAVPALAAGDRSSVGMSTAAARTLILRMAALLGFAQGGPVRARAAAQAGGVAEAALLGFGAEPTEESVRAVNQLLVLLADHELNVSTFTVRVAASAGADLYACVCAGLASLSGTQHGGVCDRVEEVVAAIGRARSVRAVIAACERQGEEIPGFGHPLYPAADPRAEALLASAMTLGKRNERVSVLCELVKAMRSLRREPPSCDVGLVALASALRLPPGSATALFALARTAGWIAHAMEQRAAGFLLRPRARYVGEPAASDSPET